jgi:hypothetical protein
MIAIARKYDVAARDARNRALGRAGEERVLAHERAMLLSAGRTDLALLKAVQQRRLVRQKATEDGREVWAYRVTGA